ncbi:hypothetical protein EDB19DRAFT_246209 [Suillus lakei]|nr:hypothetical protein EDB19DRAFT_246209 [Suillus lakei]
MLHLSSSLIVPSPRRAKRPSYVFQKPGVCTIMQAGIISFVILLLSRSISRTRIAYTYINYLHTQCQYDYLFHVQWILLSPCASLGRLYTLILLRHSSRSGQIYLVAHGATC